MNIWLLATLVALLFAGLSGVTQKLCTNNISFQLSFVYFSIAMVCISASMPLAGALKWSSLSAGQIGLIASGGLLNGLGVYTSFAALEKGGKASIVIPIINLYPLATVIGARILLGEVLTGRQLFGLGLALVSVILLSQESPAPLPEAPVPDQRESE